MPARRAVNGASAGRSDPQDGQLLTRLNKALVPLSAGMAAAVGGVLVAAVAAGIAGRLPWAANAVRVGAALGAAVCSGVAISMLWKRRLRRPLSIIAAAAAAAATVVGIGSRDVTAMAAGVEAGCAAGLGRCVPTGRPTMPILLRDGSVQSHPVVRVITWGVTAQEEAIVERTERAAPRLDQPLLRSFYGVQPAVDGGAWNAPGDPAQWLAGHHRTSLDPADLTRLIDRARAIEHWPDTPDTQYWVATDLTSARMGLGAGACADHVHVPGLRGSVNRLPFGSCTLPAGRPPEPQQMSCRPVAVVRPAMHAPSTIEAGIETFIGHEFAEAATDPSKGWAILVASRCHGDAVLEIADVCEPDGSFISAPAWDTPAGWQPSLLEPANNGRPARCVDPARP